MNAPYRTLRAQLDGLSTEAHRPELAAVDTLSTVELIRLMNAEDAKVPTAIAGVADRLAETVDAVADRMRRGGRLIHIGAGTAGRMGVLDSAECPPTFNTRPGQVVAVIAGGTEAMLSAVEGAEDDGDAAVRALDGLGLRPEDTVVGISASGRTPFAVAAVRHARAAGALTVGLSCNSPSELGRAADIPLEIVVGPEFLTGSTRLKAGTCQKLVLNTLSTAVMIKLGKTYGNLMVDVRASNEKLRARSRRIVHLATDADESTVETALDAADGEVKRAILMILAGVTADRAAGLLTDHDGRLRAALDTTPPSTSATPTPTP
ncbi:MULTISPECIES: N-acetylmuramic acid 6-phosphate etherase [Streptomyces]|uniref:N-acetylmuramic acid 6-phosphate etherase n=1 Tax=Streptomyces TaxID=1883 RepID=UPI00069A6980|nr:N-acetylmuramic acid 6-phosphate etherase [Streptomyces sp. SID7805]MYU54311.1 N-acetylmuramic acid 6-phosphate etherase [Streptomyces sp. SID7805]